MRNQNNLQNQRQNTIFARGKIVEVNNDVNNPSLILFIRNGGGRRHTFLTFRYDADKLNPIKGTNVYIEGSLKNNTKSNRLKSSHYSADYLKMEQTEISNHFNLAESKGFAFPKHFAKFFIYGTVINRYVNNSSIWVELTVKDESNNVVKIQYSKNMRVNDLNLRIGDKVYIYALPISTEKLVNEEIVNFETLIAEDIVIEQ
ncbi:MULTISPECIES: hypothetical protein [Streptococcus]|uniref:hypothetical protein n=1 Tax=Streptococcus TaxID=1301 RepID=UPI0003F96FA2|nr:hypothetical protein [Streptococcus plurextorum]MDY2962963.1 hypothetical protein [Streptococcus dysgalactiae]NQJ19038.1 hypothetical protein [Streptococcus suis]HEL9630377.1 hypothetical protein [Streptococcus suis]HEM2827095.1 hypothetical protein [Streptococcus suis]HEM6119752.1 hypothetical protein [Streptococcus suis]